MNVTAFVAENDDCSQRIDPGASVLIRHCELGCVRLESIQRIASQSNLTRRADARAERVCATMSTKSLHEAPPPLPILNPPLRLPTHESRPRLPYHSRYAYERSICIHRYRYRQPAALRSRQRILRTAVGSSSGSNDEWWS